MNEYMISIRLPKDPSEDFLALIPRQRARIDELLHEGVITSYTLAADRSMLWTTLNAESEGEAETILATFPMWKYMKAQIAPLAFHQTGERFVHHMSLN